MLTLLNLLKAAGIDFDTSSYKVHLATGNEWPPLQAYYEGWFKKWQENQARRNFLKPFVIGLIEYKKCTWLFAGVYKILGEPRQEEGRYYYNTELLSGQDDLIGRVLVRHERASRQSYINGLADDDRFIVASILEQKLTVEDFPGYHQVCVSHAILKIIINERLESWFGALSNMKGVYLITDTKTGKLYVGSATGELGMLWQRWSGYAVNGHGGNVELKALVARELEDYIKNFQYSILEIADSYASDDYVLQRESHWKNVLKTREFGYNRN